MASNPANRQKEPGLRGRSLVAEKGEFLYFLSLVESINTKSKHYITSSSQTPSVNQTKQEQKLCANMIERIEGLRMILSGLWYCQPPLDIRTSPIPYSTVRLGGMETGNSEASKRVSIFSFATLGGKQVSFHFRKWNWVQAREAQIRFPAG